MNFIQSTSRFFTAIDHHYNRSKWGMATFAVIYYLIVSLQGIDFADEGFSLTFYRFIFSHPEDVKYLFLYYFTGLVGGVWELCFGWLGNYAFRILFSLTAGCIVLIAFATLRPYFRPSTIVISTLACILWPGLCLYFFNHDCLTILLFLLTIYAMNKGLDGKNIAWWIMGFFMALNISTRLPNLTLLILLFAPLIEAFRKGNYLYGIINVLRIVGGICIGSILLLLLSYLLHHTAVWFSSLQFLTTMGSDPSDTHSIFNLLSRYKNTYKSIFVCSLYGALIYLFYSITVRYASKKIVKLTLQLIVLFLFYKLLAANYYAMWGIVTASCALYCLKNRKENRLFIMGLSALTMIVIIPLGGDSYANICHSCMWLGMPILIDLLRNPIEWKITLSKQEKIHDLCIEHSAQQQVSLIAGFAFLAYVATHSVCYFDAGSKWEKQYRPVVASTTTLTTQARASLINDIVNATLQHRMPGNYLLVYDNAPMLHYLTGMYPYLGSPWSTFWGKATFEQQLFEAEHSIKQLPLIAIPKFHFIDLRETNYLSESEYPSMKEKTQILLDFIQRHHYSIVYQDPYITLYGFEK